MKKARRLREEEELRAAVRRSSKAEFEAVFGVPWAAAAAATIARRMQFDAVESRRVQLEPLELAPSLARKHSRNVRSRLARALYGDRLFEQNPVDHGGLAVLSLLLGNEPELPKQQLENEGLSPLDVLDLEQRNMKRACRPFGYRFPCLNLQTTRCSLDRLISHARRLGLDAHGLWYARTRVGHDLTFEAWERMKVELVSQGKCIRLSIQDILRGLEAERLERWAP